MPRPPTIAEIRRATLPVLRDGEITLAVLFGSVAAGRGGPASDVDIGVLAGARELPVQARLDLAVALERVLRREVDLVDLGRATPLLRFEAARGVCLFEREPGAFGDFVARALLEFDDVRVHLRRCATALLRRRTEVP
ncbi:MAG TPA: nucleotidyltransferase domain-containing protein [Polyangia bacterium]|jgi:predicted nucleotidyltransferase